MPNTTKATERVRHWHTVMYLTWVLAGQDANDLVYVEGPDETLVPVNLVARMPSWVDKKGNLRPCTLKQAKRRNGQMSLVILGEKR